MTNQLEKSVKNIEKIPKKKIELAIIQSMGNFRKAAQLLGTGYAQTITYIKKNPEIYNVFLNAKQQLVDSAEEYIQNLLNDPEVDARTKLDLAKFILKTQGKYTGWAESPQIIQQINTDGGDVDIKGIFGI